MRPWTTLDERKIKESWGQRPAVMIAKELGRSLNAVRLKASKLDLKSTLPHIPEIPKEELLELLDLGYHPSRIAAELGKSTDWVYKTYQHRKDLTKHHYNKLLRNAQNNGQEQRRP